MAYGGGFAVLLALVGIFQLTENYNDLLDFSRGYPQMMILGVFSIVIGATTDSFISRFGLTTLKTVYLLYPALVLISCLHSPIFLTDRTIYSFNIV